jgi:hypothetical protein
MTTASSVQEEISQLFALKAEWLKERMFELFTEPSYLPELTTTQPCVLIGGRGTGKTTVLRCMSYEGQFELAGRRSEEIARSDYFGFYHRVNTNRVTAFQGPELTEEKWSRAFAHYLNIVLCELILQFLEWYEIHNPGAGTLSQDACNLAARSLNVGDSDDRRTLAVNVARARIDIENYVNNVADEDHPPLSLQGAPVDTLMQLVTLLPQFVGKNFFFLIDEFENLLDYQMRVVNTLIKHSGALYSFKVGVKELGWRSRTTVNENEQLISPADYTRILIPEKLSGGIFQKFALRVCDDRISRLSVEQGVQAPLNTTSLFPVFSDEDEAELLDSTGDGLAHLAAVEIDKVLSSGSFSSDLNAMSLLEKYFVHEWARKEQLSLIEALKLVVAEPQVHRTRYENYKHAMLFTLRPRKRGIRKYYAGCDQYLSMASTNIRYFLELVDQALLRHLAQEGSLGEPISAKVQTEAAQAVGQKNLNELEGLSVHGAHLTKLLLGLGRIFQMLAADPLGHAPEMNQFHLADPPLDEPADIRTRVDRLLRAAVMHLALVRAVGNKLGDETDTREYDYMVHPIFSAFFVFSHRRKRKMTLTDQQVIGLIDSPREAIRDVLKRHNRDVDEPLPDQLQLFRGFYAAT